MTPLLRCVGLICRRKWIRNLSQGKATLYSPPPPPPPPSLPTKRSHDDIIKWKHFPLYWPFVRGIHRHRCFPLTNASDAEFWFFFFDPRLNKQFNKQSRSCWFETPPRPIWCYCNVPYSYPSLKNIPFSRILHEKHSPFFNRNRWFWSPIKRSFLNNTRLSAYKIKYAESENNCIKPIFYVRRTS